MPGQKHGADNLLTAEHMVQIGARIIAAGRAATGLVQGPRVILVTRIFNVYHTPAGEDLPCATGPAGQNTIHHINAAFHGAHDIIRLANTHQISRLVLGQLIGRKIEHLEHGLLPLTHRQTANRVAFKTNGLERIGTFAAQLLIQTALLNAK